MSILDKLFGHDDQPKNAPPQRQQASYQGSQYQSQPPQQPYTPTNQPLSDDQAVARYQYMLRTAPPETIEQAHQEAFAQLTPEQRRMVLQQLSSTVPPAERPPQTADDPQTLARMATRAEVRQPGTMERLFGSGGPGGGSGLGMGSVIGGSLLSSLAGGFIGSAIADHFFRGPMGSGFFGGGGGFGGGYGGAPVINETNIYNEGPHDARDTSDHSSVDSTSDDTKADDSATDSDTTDNLTDDSASDDSTDYSGDDSGGSDYDSGDSGSDDF